MADIVVKNHLGVTRQTEELIKEEHKKLSKKASYKDKESIEKDPNILDYEKYLSLKTGV